MPDNAKPNTQEVLFRQQDLGIEIRAIDGSENLYEISFSSEDPVKRWFGDEILSHSADAVDLTVLNDVGTFLFSHGYDSIYGRVPIGKIERAWLDENERKCRATVSFDIEDPKAVLLKNKLDKKMIKGVSVGYRVLEWVELQKDQRSVDGRFVGPADIAVKWIPHEISLEPTPADATVGFGKSINNQNQQEERNMPNLENQGGAVVPIVTAVPTVPAIPVVTDNNRGIEDATKAVEKERNRCSEIESICRTFGVEAHEYIKSGTDVENVRKLILDKISSERSAVKGGFAGEITVVKDAEDKYRSAVVDGMLMRGNVSVNKPAEGASDFRGMRMRDIAVDCLSRSGVKDAHRMNNDELFKRALSPDSAFFSIAGDIAHKSMATAYASANTTYQEWTGKGSSTDFKPTQISQISEAGTLSEIKQNGEFRFGEVKDQNMALRQLLTFGVTFGLTRQAFINDDLDILTKIPMAHARAAQRGINAAVYRILKTNPIMGYDGEKLFSENHKNVGISGLPSTETYAKATEIMRRQTNLLGQEKLNITPKFVLSPAALSIYNEQMLTSVAAPSSSNSGVKNVFENKMQLIVDAELDVDTGKPNYFFAASPFDCDTIEVSYLNGNEMPTIESRVGFDYLGIQYRMFIDYGITLIDHRGLVQTGSQN